MTLAVSLLLYAVGVALLWRRRALLGDAATALALGLILTMSASPHLLAYDALFLTIPLAYGWHAASGGRRWTLALLMSAAYVVRLRRCPGDRLGGAACLAAIATAVVAQSGASVARRRCDRNGHGRAGPRARERPGTTSSTLPPSEGGPGWGDPGTVAGAPHRRATHAGSVAGGHPRHGGHPGDGSVPAGDAVDSAGGESHTTLQAVPCRRPRRRLRDPDRDPARRLPDHPPRRHTESIGRFWTTRSSGSRTIRPPRLRPSPSAARRWPCSASRLPTTGCAHSPSRAVVTARPRPGRRQATRDRTQPSAASPSTRRGAR